MELRGELLVHAEEVANLAATHADVAGGHVHIGSDDFIKFHHEGLAEAHNLGIALATGSEVRAALAAAHGQRGEGVLERLLEAQELQDRKVHRGVEAQTALVGANGAVELHAVADVHLHLALVVDPGHAERDDALRLHEALHYLGLFKLGVLVVYVLDALQDFAHCLQELRLARVLALQALHNFLNFHSFTILSYQYVSNTPQN